MVEDSSASFSFGRDEAFGIVEMVDTATVVVSVDDPAALARIQVNRLVAILGTRVGELYIGMVSKIVRKANLDDLWTAGDGVSFASDTVKVLLVGTVREKDGTKKNVFKRSIASVPTVGAEVFLIEKDRLSILMGAISGDVGDGIAAETGEQVTVDWTLCYRRGNPCDYRRRQVFPKACCNRRKHGIGQVMACREGYRAGCKP